MKNRNEIISPSSTVVNVIVITLLLFTLSTLPLIHQTVKNFKFEQEARISTGVCMRRRLLSNETGEEGELEGVRLPLFNYTSKNILTISNYEKKIKEEIERTKSIKDGRTAGWIQSTRRQNQIFEFDCVSCLLNVGEEKKKRLQQAGINYVCELAALGENEEEIKIAIKKIAEETQLSVQFIRKLHAQALEAEHGDPPIKINHLNTSNPYESRYGERWRCEIKKVKNMKKIVCVTDLVSFICEESAKAYQGTKHEND